MIKFITEYNIPLCYKLYLQNLNINYNIKKTVSVLSLKIKNKQILLQGNNE